MAFTTTRCTLKPNEGRLVEQAARQLPVGAMADLLYDHELLLLIQASPLGVDGNSDETNSALRHLVGRGLMRADTFGLHRLTPRGRATLGANVGRSHMLHGEDER